MAISANSGIREEGPAGEDTRFHLKLGRGSLSDIEWTAQLLQLQRGVRATDTLMLSFDADLTRRYRPCASASGREDTDGGCFVRSFAIFP